MITQCSKTLHRHCHQNLLSHFMNHILTLRSCVTYHDPTTTMGFRGGDHGILDKTVLPRLLSGKAGLRECNCLWTPLCLKYLYFWALNVHTVFWQLMLPLSEVVEWETTHIISHVFKMFCLADVFLPYICYQPHIVKSALGKVVLYLIHTCEL